MDHQDKYQVTCLSCGQANRVPVAKLDAGPKCARCGARLVDGAVHNLNAVVHGKATRGDQLPLIVDYWAPWCGPCKTMAPEFAKAAEMLYPNVRFAKINTEDHPTASQKLAFRGIPLLILYRGGIEVSRVAGARPAAEIEAFVRQHI